MVKAEASEIGQWQYLNKSGVWQNIERAAKVNNKGMIEGNTAELLFLTPAQKIRFKPAKKDAVWRKLGVLKTMLRFVLWDQSDGFGSGLHVISLKGIV